MNKAFAACLVGAVAIAAMLLVARRGESAGPEPASAPAVADRAGPAVASNATAVPVPALTPSAPAYAGGPVDIRTTTAEAVVDFAERGGVDSQLQALMVLIHCLSIDGMNEPTPYDGKTLPSYSSTMSELRKQMLAQYEKFCGNSGKGRTYEEAMKGIKARLVASPDYAKDIWRMSSEKPWTLDQAQAAIQALSSPEQHPAAIRSFVMRAVRKDQLNSLDGQVIVYRELTGDHDPYSAINAFLCLNNDVCDSNAELALKEPQFADEANVFLQRVRRQDWRALGLQ